MNRAAAVSVATLFVGGCPHSGPLSNDEPPSLEVALTGCSEQRTGPRCGVRTKDVLTLWWRSTDPETQIELRFDDTPHTVEGTEVDGGLRVQVDPPSSARALRLMARRGAEAPVEAFRLGLSPVPDQSPAFVEAELIRRQEPDRALALLDGLKPPRRPLEEVERTSLRAKIHLARGSFDRAIELWRKAARIAEDDGLLELPIRQLGPIAFVAMHKSHDSELARRTLASMEGLLSSDYAKALHAHYVALWDRTTGRFRAAGRGFRRALALSARLSLDGVERQASAYLSDVLRVVGAHEAGLEVLDEHASGRRQCDEAGWHGNRAWLGLMAREADRNIRVDVQSEVERALALPAGPCSLPMARANHIHHAALSALQSGRPDTAMDILQDIETSKATPPELQIWILDTRGRAAVALGQTKIALRAFRELEGLAERLGLPKGVWRAQVGFASSLVAEGRTQEALRVFQRAEAVLERNASANYLPSSAAELVLAHGRVARQHAGLLLREGQLEDAVKVLERHRRRSLGGVAASSRLEAMSEKALAEWERWALLYAEIRSQLEDLESRRWGLSKAALQISDSQQTKLTEALDQAFDQSLEVLERATPHPHQVPARPAKTLILGLAEVDHGAFVYVRGEDGYAHRQLPPLDENARPAELVSAILAPFESTLERHARIEIHADERFAEWDLHLLPWKDGRLIDKHIVTYSVGAPRRGRPTQRSRALIVSDPDGSLPFARKEGTVVLERLAKFEPQLWTGNEVRYRRLVDAMDVELLHWAGHARPVQADLSTFGGTVLPLQDGVLSPADVLALPRVPRFVVLAGCETAKPGSPELDMAQAFLLSGAEAVLASTVPIKDRESLAFAERLYVDGAIEDLAGALAKAQRRALEKGLAPGPFRVYVP